MGKETTDIVDQQRKAILGCVIPALFVPFIGSLVYFVLLAGNSLSMLLYGATKVFTIVWPVIAVYVIQKQGFPRGRIDWEKHVKSLPLGLLTGGVIGGAIVGLYFFSPLGEYAAGHSGSLHAKLVDMGVSEKANYIWFCLFLAGIHSLIEEFYWRWFVFGQLSRVASRKVSYFASNLGFAGHHYVVLGCYFSAMGAFVFGTGVGVGGAIWCWMYRRQKTLAGCWLSHALVDAAIFVVGYHLVFVKV